MKDKTKTFFDLHRDGTFEKLAKEDTKSAKLPSGFYFMAWTGEIMSLGGYYTIKKGFKDGINYPPGSISLYEPGVELDKDMLGKDYVLRIPESMHNTFEFGPVVKFTEDIDPRLEQGQRSEKEQQEILERVKRLKDGLEKPKFQYLNLNDLLETNDKEQAYAINFGHSADLCAGIKGDPRRPAIDQICLVIGKKEYENIIKDIEKNGLKNFDNTLRKYSPKLMEEFLEVVHIDWSANLKPYKCRAMGVRLADKEEK